MVGNRRDGTVNDKTVITLDGKDSTFDAAIKAGVKLCGPWAWRDRPDFSCFQAGNEMAAIARGVKAELGEFADTQGKPEVGPFAAARTK